MTSPRMHTRTPSRDVPPTTFAFAPIGKALMEALPDGVLVFDPFGRMVYANQSARSAVEWLASAGSMCRQPTGSESGCPRGTERTSPSFGSPGFSRTSRAAKCFQRVG